MSAVVTAASPPLEISYSGGDPRAWDEFLMQCPGAHHEQSSLWGEVRAIYGWASERVLLHRDENIVAGFQILTKRTAKFLRIGYICKGPVSSTWDSETVNAITTALNVYAERNRISYLVAELPYDGAPLVRTLRESGFVQHPEHLPPSGLMKATTIVDLRPELPEIMARMSKTGRYNIRRGEREGVAVREGGVGDLKTFRALMLELCARLGVQPTPPQPDFFENLFKIFGPVGQVSLFLAEIQNQVVSAAVVFFFGDSARLWKVGWTGHASKACPNNVLWWGAMKAARERGYKFFDLVSIDENIARRVLAGEEATPQEAGASHFKLGFGGEVSILPGPYTKFFNPVLRIAADKRVAKFAKSKGLYRLANLLRGRRTGVKTAEDSGPRSETVQ